MKLDSMSGSGSLNLSSSSTGKQNEMAMPVMLHNSPSGSRSSSVRSVRTGSKKPSSAVVRVGHAKGRNRRSQSLGVPMNVDSPSEGRGFPSGFHQGEPGQNGPTERPSDQRVLNQVYVAPSLNPEVVRQAAVEVLSANQRETETRAEAERVVSSLESKAQQLVTEARTKAAVEVAQVQSQAASFAAHTASEAAQTVAQTQANAAQAIMNHERALVNQFAEREKDLVAQIWELQQELISARATSSPSLRHNDAELMARIDQLVERMGTFEFDLLNLNQRLVALEQCGFGDINAVGDPEEELIPDTGIPPPPVPPLSPARSARHVPRSNQQSEDDDDDPVSMEDQCLRWKDVSSVKLPPLPDSAGALRSWKNAVLPMLIALDKSDQNFLYTWLMEAFHAKLPHEVEQLRFDSGGFPRFDRMLCSWLTRDSCLRGYFGPRIQSYLEESMTQGLQLRGRVLLNMIIREFDLDGALGGVVSSVELFQIPSPEGDQASLVSFRDRVQFILGQLPITDRPPDAMLSKWLFERLKRIRSMQIVLDRIRESGSNAVERSFEYLWGRLQRQIAEQQHEKNLSSIQEGLRKGPKKLGTPASPSKVSPDPKAAVAATQGGKGKGKGKPKGKGGLGKGKGSQQSPPASSLSNDSKSHDKKNPSNAPKKESTGSNEPERPKGPCIFSPRDCADVGLNARTVMTLQELSPRPKQFLLHLSPSQA